MKKINTTKGEMDESALEHREEIIDNDNEKTVVTEYYHGGELVHRSAHITLKQAGVVANAMVGNVG